MKFILISGLSGAGKSKAASFLEDMGYYVVDNMPAALIPKFAELCMAGQGQYDRVALVTDIRGGQTFDGLFSALDQLHEMGCDYKILCPIPIISPSCGTRPDWTTACGTSYSDTSRPGTS